MTEQQLKGLSAQLHHIVDLIREDVSESSMASVEQQIRTLRTQATPAQLLRIERFFANHLLDFPAESQMTPGLRDCMDECMNSAYQYKTKAELMQKTMAELCGLELAREDGRDGAVITMEPSDPSKIRVSYFNEHGFSGDFSRTTTEALIDELWHEGYMFKSPGLLQKMSALRSWAEGSSFAFDVQQVNQGTMALSQYYENRKLRMLLRSSSDIWCDCMHGWQHKEPTPLELQQFIQEVTTQLQVVPTQALIERLLKDPTQFIPPSDAFFIEKPEPAPIFVYGLKSRPAMLGAVPGGFSQEISPGEADAFLRQHGLALSETDRRHGVLVYPTPLTSEQVAQFELKIPFVPGQLPVPSGDLSDFKTLKDYALELMQAGFVQRETLKDAWRDFDDLSMLVDSVMKANQPSASAAPSAKGAPRVR